MTGERASRCVVSDPPGEATRLALYSDAGALAYVDLDPATAVAIAGDLIEAARVRFGRARDRRVEDTVPASRSSPLIRTPAPYPTRRPRRRSPASATS